MAFYFALLNVSNAHLDNKLHHGNRRSRSSSNRPPHAERRHSFSSTASNEVVNDYRLLPRPRILSSQSVARPPTPPQRRSNESVAENCTRAAQSSSQQKSDRTQSREGGESSSCTPQPKTLVHAQLRNTKKVTFETDRNGDVVNHHNRRVPFLDDPEAWGSEATGSPTVGRRPRSCENQESRWKWIAKMRYRPVDQRGLKALPQKKSMVDVNTAVEETQKWAHTPPPAYPDIIDSPPPTETSYEESSEYSPESLSRTSSDRSSTSELFAGNTNSKRRFAGVHRISRKPWKRIIENNAIDASWKSTKSFMTFDTIERIFSRTNAFRMLRENATCSEPLSVVN